MSDPSRHPSGFSSGSSSDVPAGSSPSVGSSSSPSSSSSAGFDLVVVGGGVNGVGVARDAAGRGLRVLVCEKDDLAAHTSSSSTKLIHGGLRYLEYYEFSLVRKALQEREVLLRNAPHIMWPLRFVMPHDPSMRPAWMIRLGLLMYDHLAKREVLPGSTTIRLDQHEAGAPLQPRFSRAFVYSDGWVDDARLVVLNARDAADRGAEILTGTRCERADRDADGWLVTLRGADGRQRQVRSRALVNAAGPWAGSFLKDQAHQQGSRSLRLIKGSHIVVRRLFDHPMAYIFQNPDKRIVFAIPYQQDFTLIGTTDVEVSGEPGTVAIDASEIAYLCDVINRYFRKSISPADVVWSYAGVRPLLDDASGNPAAVTRDYALELDTSAAPLMSIWGGKITTYRKLAEDVVDSMMPVLNRSTPAWTRDVPLPGGNLRAVLDAAAASGPTGVKPGPSATAGRGRPTPSEDFDQFVMLMSRLYPWLDSALRTRLARAYGADMVKLIGDARNLAGMGAEIAPGLHEAELDYLIRHEWARRGEDVLWRRSKLGLHYTAEQRAAVDDWLERRLAVSSTATSTAGVDSSCS